MLPLTEGKVCSITSKCEAKYSILLKNCWQAVDEIHLNVDYQSNIANLIHNENT